jgi:hypothetical protein
VQVKFKRDLVKEVAAFVQDAQTFRKDWEANGPMVPGLDPMEAVDRLKKFQQMFEVRPHACCRLSRVAASQLGCASSLLLLSYYYCREGEGYQSRRSTSLQADAAHADHYICFQRKHCAKATSPSRVSAKTPPDRRSCLQPL